MIGSSVTSAEHLGVDALSCSAGLICVRHGRGSQKLMRIALAGKNGTSLGAVQPLRVLYGIASRIFSTCYFVVDRAATAGNNNRDFTASILHGVRYHFRIHKISCCLQSRRRCKLML